ncbi:UNVERIFIED_CONTAM: hypothetical protein K2H54_048359 [Gekko kuhli]
MNLTEIGVSVLSGCRLPAGCGGLLVAGHEEAPIGGVLPVAFASASLIAFPPERWCHCCRHCSHTALSSGAAGRARSSIGFRAAERRGQLGDVAPAPCLPSCAEANVEWSELQVRCCHTSVHIHTDEIQVPKKET